MSNELALAVRDGGGYKASVRELLDHPESARDSLADAWQRLWNSAVAEFWPRCDFILGGEIRHRSHQLATRGLRAVIDDLHPSLSWTGDAIERFPSNHGLDIDCEGRGLTLIPSVFSWPAVHIGSDLPWRPTIYYPARNAGMLGTMSSFAGLDQLMGATRAAVLRQLTLPTTTTDISAALNISPGTATHHVTVLRAAGLVSTERVGNHAWHARTARGDTIVDLPDEL
ncbi:DUF5937 family protein [Kribbella sp. NPDC003505]|uniref:ArsR/SmtB family transcription factor n=1 Tax=Kribbella sp. NPDC003505 TaxID=3154448 RepID=UPI0033BE0AEC